MFIYRVTVPTPVVIALVYRTKEKAFVPVFLFLVIVGRVCLVYKKSTKMSEEGLPMIFSPVTVVTGMWAEVFLNGHYYGPCMQH